MLITDNDDISVVVDGASIDYMASYVNDSGTALSPLTTTGSSVGAGTIVMVSGPNTGETRLIDEINLYNNATTARTVTVRMSSGGLPRKLRSSVLGAGESLAYTRSEGWQRFDSQGRRVDVITDSRVANASFVRNIFKAGTAPEAAGSTYSFAKDGGLPGAITFGTPGVAGRAVVNEAGAIPLPTPVGANYLTQLLISAAVAGTYELWDLLWLNSGLVVTTTTDQTVNSVAFPERDDNGTANGAGCAIGMLFTAAATNAAAIANATVRYTNSAGTAGRTATLRAVGGMQIPATPVVGTIVWFQLQAGDTGVSSIQSVTLGTSLVTGSISMIVARKIDVAISSVANVPGPGFGGFAVESYPGVRLWSGTSLILNVIATATTAIAVQGLLKFADR